MKIFVKAKPGSKKEAIKQVDASHFEIRVKAPPREGKANDAVLASLARHLKIPKSRVRITSGQKSKQKVFEIS